MNVFWVLLQKLLPLYSLVVAGFFAGRVLKIDKESIAKLLIYIVVPVVVFVGIARIDLRPSYLSIPVLFFFLCSLICLIFLKIAGRFWEGSTKNLVAFSAGDANTGYFGLPVTLLLLGPDAVGLSIICSIGFIFFENSVGFYVVARGKHTAYESFQRVIRLPTLYSFFLGLIFNALGFKIDDRYLEFTHTFRGAYSVLGMMMIGMGVSSIKKFKFDMRFINLTFFAKFVVWPLVILGVIWIDKRFLHFYGPEIYPVMILISAVPLAANTVAISYALDVEPEKAAVAVLLSTFFALFFIPLVSIMMA